MVLHTFQHLISILGTITCPLKKTLFHKGAFTSPSGKYEYLKVPFGLAQALAYFQELMNKVLKDLPFAIAYLDDIIIYSKAAKQHLNPIQQVFHKLCNAELTMKLSKCHFFAKEIQYLGHVLSTTGIKPQPSKTADIKLMNPPKNAKQVRAFLGPADNYYKFIKNFACIAKPLTALTHHDAKFVWTSSHLIAFNTLKSAFLEAPIFHYQDPSKCYIVYTDASDDACGAQLSQEHDGEELPVAFLSHMFTDTQWKWGTMEEEVYGVYYAVTKWNFYPQDLTLLSAMITSLYKSF